MAKETSFREELSCPEATKAQEKVAMERIRSEIFRKIVNLDLKNNEIGPKFEELVKAVGDKYNIADTSEILGMMIELLNSGGYLYKINEEGCLVTNYSRSDMLQKQYHDRKNKEASETFQRFVDEAQAIYERLPDKKKFNAREIKKEFNYDIADKKESSIWIDLAIEKVLKLHQEDLKNVDISLEEH